MKMIDELFKKNNFVHVYILWTKETLNVSKGGGDTKLMGNWALQSKLLPVLFLFFGLIFRIPETSSNIIHYPQFTV